MIRSRRHVPFCLLLLLLGTVPALAQCPVQDVTPPWIVEDDNMGFAVDVNGDRALVSLRGHDAAGAGAGAVLALERVGPTGPFVFDSLLVGSDTMAGDLFGMSVEIEGDLAVVGAMLADEAATDGGAAYVFERVGGSWVESAKLLGSDLEANDWFGVGVSTDGERVVVGAREKDTGAPRSGVAYVFERNAGAWSQVARLVPPAPTAFGLYGHAVALDGDHLAVGAFGDDPGGAGAVHLYHRGPSGWDLEQSLPSPGGQSGDFFGISIDLQGERLVVGARFHDLVASDGGAAFVYERGDSGQWARTATLTAFDRASGDEFGNKVALEGDRIVVGAWRDRDHGPETGSAYTFVRAPGGWVHQGKFVAPDAESLDNWGHDVAVDGGVALVGAFNHDGGASRSGGAFFLDLAQLGGGRPGCPAGVHSGGVAARLEALGSASLAADRATLRLVDGPPEEPVLFAFALARGSAPFGGGELCLGQPFVPLGVLQLSTAGNRKLDLDLASGPLAGSLPGTTVHFQGLFRDRAGTSWSHHASSSLRWTLCP